MASSRTPSLRKHLVPHQKLWVNWDGLFLMGPRSLRFLAAVDRTGTIRAAGQVVGWSYGKCLNRIRQMERVLGARVLATTRGGRAGGSARLTEAARRLGRGFAPWQRGVGSGEHTAGLQSRSEIVCRLLPAKKKNGTTRSGSTRE